MPLSDNVFQCLVEGKISWTLSAKFTQMCRKGGHRISKKPDPLAPAVSWFSNMIYGVLYFRSSFLVGMAALAGGAFFGIALLKRMF